MNAERHLRELDQHLDACRYDDALDALGRYALEMNFPNADRDFTLATKTIRDRLARILTAMPQLPADYRLYGWSGELDWEAECDYFSDADEADEAEPQYECDQCGACCRKLGWVDIGVTDLQREPRLIAHAILGSGKRDAAIPLRGGCPMLGSDNRCTCYRTRPDVCREFPPGCDQCQEARELAGLPPLEPVSPPVPPDSDEYDDDDPSLWDLTLSLPEGQQ